MPVSYTIDANLGIVFSTATGILTEADALAHQAQLRQDPQFNPTFRQLYDFTPAIRPDITPLMIWSLAHPDIFAPTARRAFLVQSDLGFGLARMFQTLRDLAGEHGIGVFRDRTAALAWLIFA